MKIGSGTISWDATNNCFHFSHGLYSDSFVSAKGANSGSGGTVSGVTKLSDLSDVQIGTLATNQVLSWNGSKWVNKAVSTGLDETALAQYLTNNQYLTMPTGDARYVKKAGDMMTGDLGIRAGASTIDGSVPYAGSAVASNIDVADLSNYKTILGAITMGSSIWYNIISIRHRNGNGDGNKYGMYIRSELTNVSSSLLWGKQANGTWVAERKILDSSNYSSVIGNSFVKKAGDTMTGTLTTCTTGTNYYNQGIRINRTALNQWATLTIGYVGTATAGTSANTWLIGTPSSSNSLVFNLNSASESAGLCLKGHGNTDMKWNNQTVWHAGNDGSGSGLDADLLDGYHRSNLYNSVDTWLSSVGLSKTITVTGDKNTYYPVEITVSSSKRIPTIISIHKDLGSTTPDISGNHSSGTSSLWLIYEMRKTLWDGNGGFVRTVYKSQPYATLVANAKNNTNNGGNLIVWLRGGTCSYQVTCTNTFTATPYYTTTNVSHQTGYTDNVSPTTSISNGGIFGGIRWYGNVTGNVTGNAATATTATQANQLTTARTINGTAFNGTSNIVTSYWGTARTLSLTGNATGSVSMNGSSNVSMSVNVNYATSAGNADTLDGLHASAFARRDQNPAVDLNTVNGIGIMSNPTNANATTARHYPIQEAGTLFYGAAAYSSANQIYGTFSSNRWFFRGGGGSTTTKTAWKEMAFLTSNVASATKLQTARTIWGQSFNGTANVSGNMTGVGSITGSGSISMSGSITAGAYVYSSGWFQNQQSGEGLYNNAVDARWYANSSGWISDKKINANAGLGVSGTTTLGAAVQVPYSGGMWISMATRTNIIYSTTNNSTSSAHALYRVKDSSGNAICFGGLGANVGFYGFSATNIANNTNAEAWHTAWNVSTGTLTHNKSMIVSGAVNLYSTLSIIGAVTCNSTIYAKTGVYSDGYVSAKGQNSSSDIRLKNTLCNIKLSIKAFAKAPLFRFAWKSDPGMVEIGSSAQYWRNVLPDTVKERDGWLEMGYGNIALAGVITIARDFETLEQRVDRLEKENKRLQKRIKELERRLSV